MNKRVQGRLIVLSGPSGVGKDTVLKALFSLAPNLHRSLSYTTRPPRPGEIDGVAYSFVNEATFETMIERGELLEWAENHGYRYGTSRVRVTQALEDVQDIILKIDVKGAALVREQTEGTIFIFLMPPSVRELKQRLKSRFTEDEASLSLREQDAGNELAQAVHYDYKVVNHDVEQAAREIYAILYPERLAVEDG